MNLWGIASLLVLFNFWPTWCESHSFSVFIQSFDILLMRVINENGMNNTHCNPFKSASRIKDWLGLVSHSKAAKSTARGRNALKITKFPFLANCQQNCRSRWEYSCSQKFSGAQWLFLDTPPIPISLKWTTTYFSWWTILVQPPKVRTQPFYRVAKKAGTHVQPASRTNHH